MLPERKTIRLDHSKYLGRNIYFLTFCCEDRFRVFENADLATWIVQMLRKISEMEGFLAHAYCVMPDHVHVVVEGKCDESDVGRFVKAFKQVTAFHFKQETGERLWQKKYYDHILRGSDSLDAVMWYVWLNPVRAGLCEDARSYAYSGSFTLDWNGKSLSVEKWVPPWKDRKDEK
jgi:REP-associated tyrosine transposase